MSPEDLSLVDAAAAIREGALSPVEYVQALLARIDQLDGRLQAWVTIDRDAVLLEALRCETEARSRQLRGPLHGVPVGVKDIFYTKNLRTTMGSVLFENFVPSSDAQAVTRLKEAGAIILGKTVTTVFANLDPGPTRNAWNSGHTPGASSSGSAAAVAARMCPAAIGSQTLGSVGRPAAFNGIVSLVPSRERISLSRVFPLAWSLDHAGIFGRSVADVEVMLDSMTEFPVEKISACGQFRIGLVRGFFYDNATAEARSLNEALADKLANSGFLVEEVQLPAVFDLAQPVLRTILRSEVASVHEQLFAAHASTYGEKLRALIETGMLLDATQYLRARRLRRVYRNEMAKLFDRFDALMTPAAKGAAPAGIGSTGDPVMNAPWTLADFPTMTLPHALGGNGLPVGVQFSGPPLQESLLLGLAKAVESVIGFSVWPKSL